jgi:hypothetical protein
MHIEFLVEKPSAEAALRSLVPMICGSDISFDIHAFRSKSDLLAKLPLRLKSYRKFLPPDWRIVVLIDEDRQDCIALKNLLEEAAMEAGLITRSRARGGFRFQVLNRIAVEELEAWFFGDVRAIHQAYEKIPITLATKSAYRDPDAIKGGTWEAMERELQKAGYFKGGLAKIKVARAISANMEPSRNRSRSFQIFRQGLLNIISSI